MGVLTFCHTFNHLLLLLLIQFIISCSRIFILNKGVLYLIKQNNPEAIVNAVLTISAPILLIISLFLCIKITLNKIRIMTILLNIYGLILSILTIMLFMFIKQSLDVGWPIRNNIIYIYFAPTILGLILLFISHNCIYYIRQKHIDDFR